MPSEVTAATVASLEARRYAYLQRPPTEPLIRIWDKDFRVLARIDDPERAEWEELDDKVGGAEAVIVGDEYAWLRKLVTHDIPYDQNLMITVDPDRTKPHDWKSRWGGWIDDIEDVVEQGQPTRTTLKCTSFRDHPNFISIAANPISPMQVQAPKIFLNGGPTAFTCCSTAFINLFRIYTLNGFSPIPRNLFSPKTWLENLHILNWPVQVMPMNPLLDQTRWGTLSSRWGNLETAQAPLMKDAGVTNRAYTWLPGDPAPYTIFGPEIAERLKPRRACVILAWEDHSGVDGPTGTAIDGALNLVAATLDDLLTSTIVPLDLDADNDSVPDPFIRKLLMVAPKPSPYTYRDADHGNVRRSVMNIHKRRAITTVVGGKSPQWLNQAITFAIRYGLSQLATVISYGVGASVGTSAGTEGLDNLYQGQLDDVFMAFAQYHNPLASAAAGPYARNEHFESGAASGLSVSTLQALAAGDYKNRAYISWEHEVSDVAPFVLGEDFGLGERVNIERRGVLYTDQVKGIKRVREKGKTTRPILTLGDDTREEDGLIRAFRTIGDVANFAASIINAGDMF
ncbi:minor tail protein [Gordonia phage DumpsterDude]|uniref:Minor tail protein n=1 Tax=Gordonia phage DumpsterDude TaxID=2713262 RepID=A0A6G8R097_9CAUD|nr:minor tail protein [Gordonia phage DumpsterDude]QIN93607.1 minor tail protein [Gordonia phage DumpsterDude]